MKSILIILTILITSSLIAGCGRGASYNRSVNKISASDVFDYYEINSVAFSFNPYSKNKNYMFLELITIQDDGNKIVTSSQDTGMYVYGNDSKNFVYIFNKNNKRSLLKVGVGEEWASSSIILNEEISKFITSMSVIHNYGEGSDKNGYIIGMNYYDMYVNGKKMAINESNKMEFRITFRE